eukprot:Lithocolla_globosa_v1_NODE_8811_length_780_cov_2.852414.p1 type:complete len:124 gc:universal NODE_8811_length_780_cov_2.852414:1-372(+)
MEGIGLSLADLMIFVAEVGRENLHDMTTAQVCLNVIKPITAGNQVAYVHQKKRSKQPLTLFHMPGNIYSWRFMMLCLRGTRINLPRSSGLIFFRSINTLTRFRGSSGGQPLLKRPSRSLERRF